MPWSAYAVWFFRNELIQALDLLFRLHIQAPVCLGGEANHQSTGKDAFSLERDHITGVQHLAVKDSGVIDARGIHSLAPPYTHNLSAGLRCG